MKINYSNQATKFLQKQTLDTRARITKAIEGMPKGDIIKLQGKDGYRLRVGTFRVLFDKYGNVIEITRIENRGDAYK